jgi:hypothetical protein
MSKNLIRGILLLALFFYGCKGKESVINLTGVDITKDSVQVDAGNTIQLELTFTPADASNKNASWISSNQNIATVSSTGLVTGISAGTTDILITTEDGGFADSCKVIVNIPADPVQFTMHIGPDGGTITEPRGTIISIPPGALTHDTALTVTTYLNADEISKIHQITPFNSGVELLPQGISFDQPVTVTVPTGDPLLPNTTYDMFFLDQVHSEWNPVFDGLTDESGNKITFQTDHFSVLSVSPWFSGSMVLFPRAMGSADCISELAISNFINSFVNNYGTQLFDMKKLIDGVTYNVKGAKFDFQYNCDQEQGKNSRMLGNTTGTNTFLSDSADLVFNGHTVSTKLKITIYWALWSNPEFQSIFISESIPTTPNNPQNFNYYSTSISIPAQLPDSGNFYFSTIPDSVVTASIQGYINFNEVVVDAFDLAKIPRELIESNKGSSITVDLWAYKTEVYHDNSAIWIVWVP